MPKELFDSEKHGFKILDVAENRHNLDAAYHLIRRKRPEAAIIVTLSPIPLAATFRPVSCVTANCVSKAILRVAIDEFMRSHEDPRLFYFPSYEIVVHAVDEPFKDDLRHPRREVIDRIMEEFSLAFLL